MAMHNPPHPGEFIRYDLWQAKKSANLSKVRKIRFATNAWTEFKMNTC